MTLSNLFTTLLIGSLLLTGCIMPASSPPIEPQAGQWKT